MKRVIVGLAAALVLSPGTLGQQDNAKTAKVYRLCSPAAGVTTDCADKRPKPLYTPDPEYSEDARRNGIEGAVVMDVVVGTDGLVRDAQVTKSAGHGLDEQSLEAVRNWKFEPATMNGEPVAVRIQVQTSFRLNGSGQRRRHK